MRYINLLLTLTLTYMDQFTLRWARLVGLLGRVTVFGRANHSGTKLAILVNSVSYCERDRK